MEIIHNFGIDPILLVAQIINFGIILLVLKKFLYKPVVTMLETRRKEIKKGLDDAEKARRLLEETAEKEKKVLKTAQADAKKLIDEARKQADSLLAEAKNDTRKETERMIKEAKAQIELESRQAEKRLVTHISELAIAMLAKSLPTIINEDEQEKVLKRAAEKLKGKSN